MKMSISRQLPGVLALLCFAAAHAATVNVVASNATPKVGGSFYVTISGAGFPETFGATLGLTFDSKVVSVSSVELAPGSPFTVGVVATLPFKSGDQINLVGPLIGALPKGNFDAFRINFKVIAPGDPAIAFVEDDKEQFWLTEANKPIPATYNYPHIQAKEAKGKRPKRGAVRPPAQASAST